MSIQDEDIYVDLLLTNSIQTKSNERVQVAFNQSESQPILKNTDGYKLSIIRFTLNTETLPIFIPTMRSDTQTIYSITMSYNGVFYQQFMDFQPQNLNPVDPDEKLYVYSYQYVIYLVNQCLISCFNGLKALEPTLTVSYPTMSFDINTQISFLSIDNNYYGYNEANKINIYMNYPMYYLFNSLPAALINTNENGCDYQLNNLIGEKQNILTQEYSTVPLWNPVSSVVFTSNLLPICQSQTPPIQIYANGSLTNNNSTSNFLNIVTDFIGNDLTFTPFIQYSAEIYRFLSLKNSSSIRDIDLRVFWINKNTGTLKPLYISSGGSCSIKILLTTNY